MNTRLKNILLFLGYFPMFILFIIYAKGNQKQDPAPYNVYYRDTIILQEYFFDQAIDTLKKYEGFSDTVYTCPGGIPSIGYGHALRPGDPRHVTRIEADSICRSDLNVCIRLAYRLTGLYGNKVLAIGMLLYSIRHDQFIGSRLHKKILAREPIDDQWQNWTKVAGKTHKNTAKVRAWEQWLYTLEY